MDPRVGQLYYTPPAPYKTWADFFNNAPAGTDLQFATERHIWTAVGNGKWENHSNSSALYRGASHLCNYTNKGAYITLVEEWPAGKLTIAQLVALEEFINKQLEEAYERGKKDATELSKDYDAGWRAGYDEGWDECSQECHINHG